MIKFNDLDSYFITNPSNIFYLTGFRGTGERGEASLVFSEGEITLFVSKMYKSEALEIANDESNPSDNISKRGVEKSDKLDIKVEIVEKGMDIYDKPKDLFKKYKKIGFEAKDLRYSEYSYLDSKEYDLIPSNNVIENMRIVKTDEELRRIQKGIIINETIALELVDYIEAGMKEYEVAEYISIRIREMGGEGSAFDTIVASGTNSALPHYKTGDRLIGKDDIVLVDFGARYKGYCSDMTRTYCVSEWGVVNDKLKAAKDLVQRAHDECIKMVHDGVKIDDLWVKAVEILGDESEYFVHSLGHGLGIDIHEQPGLQSRKQQSVGIEAKLEAGMVVTIEPGLYYPGLGGVRIEDTIVV